MAKKDDLKQGFSSLITSQKRDIETEVKNNIVILPELKTYIPALDQEEFEQLEQNIIAEGCRDALILWENKGEYILIDGHNRYIICQKNKIEFKYELKDFADIDNAKNWMLANQLGKRNLTELQKSYLRGKQYEFEKSKKGGTGANQYNKNSRKEIVTHLQKPTADKLAEQHSVSSKTIKNDANYSKTIDRIAKDNPELRSKILSKEIDIPKKVILDFIDKTDEEVKTFVNQLLQKGQKVGQEVSKKLNAIRTTSDEPKKTDWQGLNQQVMKLASAVAKQDKEEVKSIIAIIDKKL